MGHKKIPWANEVAEATHTHVEADITDLDHDAQKIKGKTVDVSARANDTVIVFKSASDKYIHETKGAPEAHAATHQNGGGDEVNVAGLSGELADAQTPKAHNQALGTITGHDKAAHDALDIAAATAVVAAEAVNADTLDGEHAAAFAPAAQGVTNGDAHDHTGGDGAQIDHVNLANKGTNTHAEVDTHLAAAAPHSGHEATANKAQASGYCDLDASVKVPAARMPTAKIKTTLSFAVTGTLTTGADKAPTIVAPCALTIVKVKVVVKTAPTGASLIVDVNKAGTTIFTNQANRPEIAIGETTDDSGTPDVTALAEGDKLTIDIDQIGSGTAGADLTVEVVADQSVAFS